jgi:hypothetical protein
MKPQLGYGLGEGGTVDGFQARSRMLSLLHSFQTGSIALYPLANGNRKIYPRRKAAGT